MGLVEVDGLVRTFEVRPRRRGLLGALADLWSGETTTVRALDGVSFALERGEAVGYLGVNGAGKSTTVKCLAGLLAPTAGTVRVSGLDPWRERRRHVHDIGVVFGQRTALWWDLAVQEAFDLLAAVYGVPEAQLDERLGRLIELLEIGPLLRTPVRQLSLGQRVRCDLAAALLHGPSLVMLDEPTIGLDVAVRRRVQEFLRDLVAGGEVCVLLTTHDLGDVERICERVLLLDQGRIGYDGTLDGLRERAGLGRVLVVEAGERVGDPALQALEGALPGRVERRAEGTFAVHLPPGAPAGRVVEAVLARGPVEDLTVHEPSLEDVVAALYAGGGPGEGT